MQLTEFRFYNPLDTKRQPAKEKVTQKMRSIITSSYATWFTAGGAIRIALRQLWQTWKLCHYDVITWKL